MTDDPSSPQGQCQKCGITPVDGNTLKKCSRCKSAFYCSRDCQKEDWKQHKKRCNDIAQSGASSGNSNTSTQSTSSLSFNVQKPFHKLHDGTWLHDRPVENVYKLLIDVYRLRLEDVYNLEGKVDRYSIYGGATDGGRNGFRQFLILVESQHRLLPTWWAPEKREDCIGYGLTGGGWSNLGEKKKKSDIVEYYGNPYMPMQLRLFGEQVYGTGPGGQSGKAVMQMQMAGEKGEMFSSVFSTV